VKIYTKDSLIAKLKQIRNMGWVKSARPGNDAAVGNTLEDLLEIEENNLPLPNAGEWEIKAQRSNTSSLTTLFHMEPSPRALRFVPRVLLPKYGWPHRQAGARYGTGEMSFRQTITGNVRTDRGFTVLADWDQKKLVVSFDWKSVDERHAAWLRSVNERAGLGELEPQPYWGFDDLTSKARTKLINCFYLRAETKWVGGDEYFLYKWIYILSEFEGEKFIRAIEDGHVLIDFDARTGHNHGTKFRLKQESRPSLYRNIREV
jgi:hypothetical protein